MSEAMEQFLVHEIGQDSLIGRPALPRPEQPAKKVGR
jgi:hypothetical protein